ncbi:hypothetical protein ABT075_22930 [Streptomyces sp. NPDC002677]|uniref:hypothetical protein n=1 Tax=Streptomyces sp. NPDC002677 TaxID=3154774 RepID=UPI0033213958
MESLSAYAGRFLGQLDEPDAGVLLDEPTTGPHSVDAERRPSAVHRLVDDGNSVGVIEHDPDAVTTADRLIGMGPQEGHRSGQVIVAGTREQIAAHPGSHTGGYLGALLEETQ